MTLTPQQAALLLCRIPHIGARTIKKLIDDSGGATKALEDKRLKRLKNSFLNLRQQAHIKQWKKGLSLVNEEEKFIKKEELTTLIYGENTYPNSLSFTADPPPILFQKGHVNWENQRILSIVGTRAPSPSGQAICKQLIEELAPYNPLIVSGFAKGIDIMAHRHAMACHLETVAVLGHGFDSCYPKTHQKYQAELIQKGAFLSEYWSIDPFERSNFLKRNRIIAGLGHATLVIESAEKGGSLVTAAQALSYGREVFAVPGRLSDEKSRGCLSLIQSDNARLITSGTDIARWLGWEETHPTKAVQKQLFVTLDTKEQKLYDALEQGKTLDELALSQQLPIPKVASLLMQLELKGVVRSLAGKRFERI